MRFNLINPDAQAKGRLKTPNRQSYEQNDEQDVETEFGAK